MLSNVSFGLWFMFLLAEPKSPRLEQSEEFISLMNLCVFFTIWRLNASSVLFRVRNTLSGLPFFKGELGFIVFFFKISEGSVDINTEKILMCWKSARSADYWETDIFEDFCGGLSLLQRFTADEKWRNTRSWPCCWTCYPTAGFMPDSLSVSL